MDQIDFSEFFSTKAEASDFLSRLTKVSDQLFQTNFHLGNALTEQFGINKSDRFLALLRENNTSPESLENVKNFLLKMIETVSSLPVLSLTIAFEPTEETLKSLSEWVLLNLRKQMIFDITVNHHLVAGASININGKFRDFSIKPLVEKVLHNYTTRITTPTPAPQPQPAPPPVGHQNVNDISFGR